MLETFRNLARSVFGMNHVKDTENQYLEVVGNGLDAEHPRNARTLDIAGNEVLAGRLTVGAQPVDDNDVATKKYVDDNGGSGGDGDNIFVVPITFSNGTWSAGKTFQETLNAMTSGKLVFANMMSCVVLPASNLNNSLTTIQFSGGIKTTDDSVHIFKLTFNSDESVTYEDVELSRT